jgi:hypothetical protein
LFKSQDPHLAGGEKWIYHGKNVISLGNMVILPSEMVVEFGKMRRLWGYHGCNMI